MQRRRFLVLCLLLLLACPRDSSGESKESAFFDPRRVHEIHFEITSEQWSRLQPPANIDWDFGNALQGVMRDARAGRNFHSSKSSRPGIAGYMGVDHQYGRANVTIDDQTIEQVGLRYKGNGTFFSGHEVNKFSFKIDFNEYHDELEFRRLTKVNLNSNSNDPSMLRESLAYALFREAGVPAPRTGWAKVYLSVEGQSERKYLGLYLLVEQVDKRFLKRVYGSSKGLLLKPSTFGVFRYFGDDWTAYQAAYFPKTEASQAQQQRLIEFARLIRRADDKQFADSIDDYLDIEEFISFLSVNVILANLDSFLGGSQNYYVYLEPGSNKFQLLPWDLDISFGAFSMAGTPDSRRNLSIDRPQISEGGNPLLERLLAIPRFREAYHEQLRNHLNGIFAEQKMLQQIDQTAAFLKPHVALEGDLALRKFEAELMDAPSAAAPHAIKYFVRQRRKSIQLQLVGKSKGEHLNWDNPLSKAVVAKWIGLTVVFLAALACNAGAWIWAVIAGFRDGSRWGLLNMFFYPISPLVYGFRRRIDIGKRSAIAVLASVLFMVVIILVIIALR